MISVADGMPQINDKRKGELEKFAPFVSPLPWFTIDILHKLYINIFVRHTQTKDEYRIRAITCSDILHSPSVIKVGYNVFMFRPEVQEELRGIINPQKKILREIATFMLAYIVECRPHFLGLKYVESFRIEGNLILNPTAEAGRISSHIVNRLNQIRSFDQKKNTVAYYLNILEASGLAEEQKQLIRFLQGYEKFDGQSGNLPEEWKALPDIAHDTTAESITIKLPYEVRERILAEIQKAVRPDTKPQTVHAMFVGINQYADTSIFPLQGAVKDASAMAAYFSHNATIESGIQTKLLLDQQATKSNILLLIAGACQQAVEGDIIFFYFAGYGGKETASDSLEQIMNQNVMPSVPDEQSVLICYDTMTGGDKPALAVSEVMYAFSKLPNDCQCIFMYDSGFHRQEMQGSYKARSLAEDIPFRRPEQWIWGNESFEPEKQEWSGYSIHAADEFQNVYETPDGGLFTTSLLEALQRNQHNITYGDIISEVEATGNLSDLQKPKLVAHGNFNLGQIFLSGLLREGKNVDQRIQYAADTKAEKLDLSGLQLAEIPTSVYELIHIRELNLSDNQITSITDQIVKLLNLQALNISRNPINKIDEALGQLKSLSSFTAQECGLKAFPYMLLNCKKMFRIDLAQNKIQWVPIQIGDNDFHPDAQLVLSGNPVLNIPEELLLSRLERFKAHFKEWEIRPIGRHRVAVLIGFDFDNSLRYLREEISFLEKTLKEVGIETMTLFNPSAEDVYRTLYERQEQMTILHIGAERIDKLKVTDETIRDINEETIVELFRCIRQNAFPAKLAFFNYCNSDVILSELMPDSFVCAIGTEDKIDDEVAFNWSRVFYSRLVKGDQLEECFANSLIEYSRP